MHETGQNRTQRLWEQTAGCLLTGSGCTSGQTRVILQRPENLNVNSNTAQERVPGNACVCKRTEHLLTQKTELASVVSEHSKYRTQSEMTRLTKSQENLT